MSLDFYGFDADRAWYRFKKWFWTIFVTLAVVVGIPAVWVYLYWPELSHWFSALQSHVPALRKSFP